MHICFGGDGTDFPAYYERHGGLVVSATIGYYVYVILSPGSGDEVHIIAADPRLCQRSTRDDLSWDNDLSVPKAITDHFNLCDGLTVFLAAQVPSGTGLGSPGCVAVSMVKALAFWCGLDLAPRQVAEMACHIELEKMAMPIGKQDQYAAAFGGLDCIKFSRGNVSVDALRVSPETRGALESRLMLFFAGTSQRSSSVLQRQTRAGEQKGQGTLRTLEAIKELGAEICAVLEQGDLEAFGTLLHQSWLEQCKLTDGVIGPFLDQCYQTARQYGALGGRVTGPGGGGFLVLYCPEDRQPAVTQALTALGLQRWPLALDDQGVQVMEGVPWARQHVPHHMPFAVEANQIGTR
jgi:D-glycero-alpha-D-manno-heptose-7-phosphate kinase